MKIRSVFFLMLIILLSDQAFAKKTNPAKRVLHYQKW